MVRYSPELFRFNSEVLSEILGYLDVKSVVSLDESFQSSKYFASYTPNDEKLCMNSSQTSSALRDAYRLSPLPVFNVYPSYSAETGFMGVRWAMKREIREFCPRKLILPRNVDHSLQLQYLCEHDCVDIAEYLVKYSNEIDYNMRPNETCMTILHYAAWKGYTCLVSLLLSRGVDTTKSYGTTTTPRTPLLTAMQHGHSDIVALLKNWI